jgi:LPXTG-site transpeptidase (sortase) family protein
MFRSAGGRRAFLVGFAALTLVAGSLTLRGDHPQQVVAIKRPTTTLATTTTTLAATAPVAAAPPNHVQRVRVLPGERPARTVHAASYRGPTPTGRIVIPRIGLNHLTYEGIELSTIDYGPSHWPGTAMPGDVGNTVFPGHRVTHDHPFFDIDLIQVGDQITFINETGRFTYEVTDHFVVNADETWIADQTDTPTMTIFGCHPKHSAKQRYVVKGKLVNSERAYSSSPPPDDGKTAPGDGNTYTPPPPETTTTTQPRSIIPPL